MRHLRILGSLVLCVGLVQQQALAQRKTRSSSRHMQI